MNTYESLSIHVTKDEITEIVKGVFRLDFVIFWGFDQGKMILNIYNEDINNKLVFRRHKGYLELIYAEIKAEQIIDVLDNTIYFSRKVDQTQQTNKQHLDDEIDWYLSELNRFLHEGDEQKIEETKKILSKLVSKRKEQNRR